MDFADLRDPDVMLRPRLPGIDFARLGSVAARAVAPGLVDYLTTPAPPPQITPNAAGKVPSPTTHPAEAAALGDLAMLGGAFLGPGVGAGLARSAGLLAREASGVAAREAENLLASKSARIYNPPAKPLRPFAADYPPEKWPGGVPADANGRLLVDREGRSLTAERVVGRRMVGGKDEAVPPEELDALAEALTGRTPAAVSSRAMGQKLGHNLVNRYTGQPVGIELDRSLNTSDALKVLAHEIGHAIDQIAGNIPTKGLSRELKAVYNTLNNPNRAGAEAVSWGKPFRPQDLGYEGDEVGREYIVEAIRAYMADPNYLKTVAPNVAKAIRAVNDHPTLSKFIQFNAVAGLLGGRALSGSGEQEDPSTFR